MGKKLTLQMTRHEMALEVQKARKLIRILYHDHEIRRDSARRAVLRRVDYYQRITGRR